jgi:hypothetical protein
MSTTILAMCLPCHMYGSATSFIQTCHVSSYGCATCHPCSGDTCHFPVGPPVLSMSTYVHVVILLCVTSRSFHISVECAFHVICMVVRHVQSASTWHCTYCMDYTIIICFACLEKQTDHHNVSIRHSFEPVQVVLGSYRRDLHTHPF